MNKFYLLLTIFIKGGICVPPSPTNGLQEDIAEIKNNIHAFTAKIEQLNTIYITQIEPRLVSSAVDLSSLGSNVRNLQERAHVWDTFQLHVLAWNDQLASLDRKINILNKGQEKLLESNTKLNSVINIELRLDELFQKVQDVEEKINDLSKNAIHHNLNHDALFGEFATRGILSTLKSVEKKLDNLHLTDQNSIAKIKQPVEYKPTLSTKCHVPPIIEELLKDVSSKVDVIFDKMSGHINENNLEEFNVEYLDDQQVNTASPVESENDPDVKLFKKVLKRLNQPCKQHRSLLQELVLITTAINNNTLSLIERPEDASCTRTLNISQSLADHANVIKTLFYEQRSFIETSLKNYVENAVKQCSVLSSNIPTNDLPMEDENPQTVALSYDFLDEIAESCEEITGKQNGIYLLKANNMTSIQDSNYNIRYCENRDGSFWTVIQRRDNFRKQQNFSLSWTAYKAGFGNLREDFWIGNEYLHLLTQNSTTALRIELEDFDGNTAWAEYEYFKVLSETENYKLLVAGYTGNASDSLSSHHGSQFSTFDRKNDEAPPCCPCAVSYGGGWWFNRCFEANLNGLYHRKANTNDYYRGIIWEHWLGNYSLKKSLMMLKQSPKNSVEFTTDSYDGGSGFTIPYYEDP